MMNASVTAKSMGVNLKSKYITSSNYPTGAKEHNPEPQCVPFEVGIIDVDSGNASEEIYERMVPERAHLTASNSA
jgi:hypothetical protein